MRPVFKPIADSAILIEFENHIDEHTHNQVLALMEAAEQDQVDGILEIVPSYKSLLVYYDPLIIAYPELKKTLQQLSQSDHSTAANSKLWEVPVWYDGPTAMDLERVAQTNGLSTDEVIEIHSSTTYRVYLIGFAPGWTFLGGLDDRLHTPRLTSPRAQVPTGSISIAGQQGLICGPAMPSGWNLIGQTPEHTWAPEREVPCFIQPGDNVRFRRIDADEFLVLQQIAQTGGQVSTQSSHPGSTSNTVACAVRDLNQ